MGKFAEQIDGILNGEMTIHKQYAKRLGISVERWNLQNHLLKI